MGKKSGLLILLCAILVIAYFYFLKTDAGTDRREIYKNKDPAQEYSNTESPINIDRQEAEVILPEQPDPAASDSLGHTRLPFQDSSTAFEAILHAADNGLPGIITQFNFRYNEQCIWCDELYTKLSLLASDTNESMLRRFFAAEILAASGNIKSMGHLLHSLEKDPNGESSELYMEAIARARPDDNFIEYTEELLSGDIQQKTRQSLTAMLGYQSSLKAVQVLYNELSRNPDLEGFAELGIGIVVFQADEEAFSFLEDKISRLDDYSAFALSALLQSGPKGVDRAVSILKQVDNEESLNTLLNKTTQVIKWRNHLSLQYLPLKAESEENIKLKEFLLHLELNA